MRRRGGTLRVSLDNVKPFPRLLDDPRDVHGCCGPGCRVSMSTFCAIRRKFGGKLALNAWVMRPGSIREGTEVQLAENHLPPQLTSAVGRFLRYDPSLPHPSG